MLGHKLVQGLPAPIETVATVRSSDGLPRYGFYFPDQIVAGVDAMEFATIERAIDRVEPEAVVNCIGIVKQHSLASDPVACLTVNALLPHRIQGACKSRGIRFVHISTDCVFDGATGGYKEGDATNAEDLYGRTKALGEVSEAPGLTLRTSIIGRELHGSHGLVEWFLSQRGGRVRGYSCARFSGLTTNELCRVVARVLLERPKMSGLWHVASEPIDKRSLLEAMNEIFGTETEIVADSSVHVDRALDGTAFRAATGYAAPGWREMVAEMAADPTPYDSWRN